MNYVYSLILVVLFLQPFGTKTVVYGWIRTYPCNNYWFNFLSIYMCSGLVRDRLLNQRYRVGITLTILGERYKLWSSSLWSIFHSPFAPLLSPNIRLRILFSNALILCSSLNVRGYASQLYSTTGNIIVSYILNLKFLERSREDKRVWSE